jgi:hypothetical protein
MRVSAALDAYHAAAPGLGIQPEDWGWFEDPRGSLPGIQRPHILDARRRRKRKDSETDALYIDDGRFERGEAVGARNEARPTRRRRRN